MIHPQRKIAVPKYVPPKEEQDIELELLERSNEPVIQGLMEKIDALQLMQQRIAELTQQSTKLEETIRQIPAYKEVMKQKEELRKEQQELAEETNIVLEEIIPAFKVLEGNTVSIHTKLGDMVRKLKIVVGRLQQGHEISYKSLAEYLVSKLRELDTAIPEDYMVTLSEQFRAATEDFGPAAKIFYSRYQRTHYAGLLDELWMWLKKSWNKIMDALAGLFQSTDEALEKASDADDIVNDMLVATQDLE